MAQIIVAVQMVYEQKFIMKYNIPPLLAVGLEGDLHISVGIESDCKTLYSFLLIRRHVWHHHFKHIIGPHVFHSRSRNVLQRSRGAIGKCLGSFQTDEHEPSDHRGLDRYAH